jgi:hypothetical protein
MVRRGALDRTSIEVVCRDGGAPGRRWSHHGGCVRAVRKIWTWCVTQPLAGALNKLVLGLRCPAAKRIQREIGRCGCRGHGQEWRQGVRSDILTCCTIVSILPRVASGAPRSRGGPAAIAIGA